MKLIEVDARGEACPLPLIKTRQAIESLGGPGTVETLVDDSIAVQNLNKLAVQKGYTHECAEEGNGVYRVRTIVPEQLEQPAGKPAPISCDPVGDTVVVISADHMGEGDPKLGRTLIKGFLFALTQQESLPQTLLFYNGGAALTCEASESLEDLRNLAAQGVEILTCGTCLNFYGLSDKLAVGTVTNMYEIVERQMTAGRILRP